MISTHSSITRFIRESNSHNIPWIHLLLFNFSDNFLSLNFFQLGLVSLAHGVYSVCLELPWNGTRGLPHTPVVSSEVFKEEKDKDVFNSLPSRLIYLEHQAQGLVRGHCCPLGHCHLSLMLSNLSSAMYLSHTTFSFPYHSSQTFTASLKPYQVPVPSSFLFSSNWWLPLLPRLYLICGTSVVFIWLSVVNQSQLTFLSWSSMALIALDVWRLHQFRQDLHLHHKVD